MKHIILFLILLTGLCYSCSEKELINNPPETPVNILPMDGDTLISTSISFEWYSEDSDGDKLTYDLHFGKSENPPIIASDISLTKFTFNENEPGLYYWYLTVKDEQNTVDGSISSIRLINPADMPVITTIVLNETSKSKATVSSSYTSTNQVLEQGFVWSRRSMPTKNDKKIVVEGANSSFDAALFELYDKTNYHVRSFITVELGTVYSEELIFESWDDGITSGTIIDPRDEQAYDYISIGSQKWMTRNLAYLPKVNEPLTESIEEPFYYVYGYFGDKVYEAAFTDNYQTYGVLYNWAATIEESDLDSWKVQGACPDGWHVPNDEEWDILMEFLGGRANAGGKLKERGFDHWNAPNTGAEDLYGFTALPGGSRGPDEIPFTALGTRTFWWSSTERDAEFANRRYLYNEYNAMGVYYQLKSIGFSVRCLKD